MHLTSKKEYINLKFLLLCTMSDFPNVLCLLVFPISYIQSRTLEKKNYLCLDNKFKLEHKKYNCGLQPD